MKVEQPLVFSTRKYALLCERVCAAGGFDRGQVETEDFPDGELYQRIASDSAARHCVVIGGTPTDEDTLELYDLSFGVVMQGAESLTIVIPYFGYSTMERAVRRGEVVKAKVRARLFSTLETAAIGNRVILLDLHTDGITHYFEGSIRPVHVYGKSVVTAAARRLAKEDFVLACTDAGRAKWVESLANDLGVGAAFVFKRRVSGEKTEITGISADVRGRDVVIYDDMIRTGGSLISAAAAYRRAGAGRMWAIATHGVFPGGALEKLEKSGLFEGVVTTDSHPRAIELAGGFLHVESIAPVLAAAIVS
jgi:ribose-phosphate pyrophosphokinase